MDQKGRDYCPHIKPAREAFQEKRFAEAVFVNVDDLVKKLADEEVEKSLQENSSDGEIAVYILPGIYKLLLS